MAEATHTTVDPAEVERFQRVAAEWWDPNGKLAPLHRLNPLRLAYIRDRAAAHWHRDPLAGTPLAGLSLLDVGCGGGLIAEPMARRQEKPLSCLDGWPALRCSPLLGMNRKVMDWCLPPQASVLVH